MKSLKINSLLALSFVTGLLIGGNVVVSAQGIEPPSIRDCARQLCFSLRQCDGEGQIPDKTQKPEGTRKNYVEKQDGADTQGRPVMTCRSWAYQEYLYCSGGGYGGVKPQGDTKPSNTKK